MPALNLKTKTLRYHASDETALEAALTLLQTIVEYDADCTNLAGQGEHFVSNVLAHVRQVRSGAEAAKKQPAKAS